MTDFGETVLFVQDYLIERFLFHDESDHSYITYDFLSQNFDWKRFPIVTDSAGRQTVTATVAVSTPKGIYVTILHMAVETDTAALGDKFVGWEIPAVILGRDWYDATEARLRQVPEEREIEHVVDDCQRSWGDERGAWFSWAHYPGS